MGIMDRCCMNFKQDFVGIFSNTQMRIQEGFTVRGLNNFSILIFKDLKVLIRVQDFLGV